MAETVHNAGAVNPPGLGWRKRDSRFRAPFIFAVKLLVTSACFWYLLRRIDLSEVLHTRPVFDFGWISISVLVSLAQIPLLAFRLQAIVQILGPQPELLTYLAANAVTAIYGLFAQVLPGVAGEGVRAWMLTRLLGCDWRTGLTSVVVDRGIGLAVLITFGFIILFLPSALSAFGGDRNLLRCLLGGVLVLGVVALLALPRIAPVLQRWRYSYWIGTFASDAHRALVGPQAVRILGCSCLVHILTIIVIWTVGRAQGLSLSVFDCAVLFTVVTGVVLIPISIGGWGLREIAVVQLLGAHGVAAERALLFSLCLGLVFFVSALPGAIVWLLYSFPAKEIVRPL
jgi:uncharacterized membrane protein YbhN (UPF0104 family)